MSVPRLIFFCLLSLIRPLLAFTPVTQALNSFPSGDWRVLGGRWSASQDGLKADGDAKVLFEEAVIDDFQLDIELRIDAEGAEAGVIFHGSRGVKGSDALSGHYTGIGARKNLLIWGANDPDWRIIASRPLAVAAGRWYHLRVQAVGAHMKIYLDGQPITDGTWPAFDGLDPAPKDGGIALRAAGGAASFRNLSILPYQPEALSGSYTNPVQAGCADPCVFHHDGKYYAYATDTTPAQERKGRGIRLFTSADLVHWADEGFAVRDKDSWGKSGFWAPDIVERDGTFYLYYAADERMCVATAKSPMGPFRQERKEPMLPESIRIDGHVFSDDDGQRYFYYVAFNHGNEIWGGKLNDDMLSVDPGSLRLMVRPDQPWECHQAAVTEGPEMIKHKGIYYLTYSGSHFRNADYAVGYATSENPLGPWKKYEFNPVMKSTGYARGTGHHCFTESPDGKELFMVYHRHLSEAQADPRQLSIDRVRFLPARDGGPDILEVDGPTSSPQPMPSGAK